MFACAHMCVCGGVFVCVCVPFCFLLMFMCIQCVIAFVWFDVCVVACVIAHVLCVSPVW